MKMNKHLKKNDAVSPVVGVMLMLVVTIIIAAVVASFAGGLTENVEPIPTAIISAEFSQNGLLAVHHIGGDSLATPGLTVVVRPTEDFGSYTMYAWTLPNNRIFNNSANATALKDSGSSSSDVWVKTSGYTGVSMVSSGDTFYIATSNVQVDPTFIPSATNFSAPSSIGKHVTVELYKNDKLIASTQTVITA